MQMQQGGRSGDGQTAQDEFDVPAAVQEEERARLRGRRHWRRWAALSVLGLFLFLWGILNVVASFWAEAEMKRICGKDYPQLIAFLDSPIDVPEEWLVNLNVSAELEAALAERDRVDVNVRNYSYNWLRTVFRNIPDPAGPRNSEWERSARELLDKSSPLVEALEEISSVAGRELQALPAGGLYCGAANRSIPYYFASDFADEPQLLGIKGSLLFAEGKQAESIDCYLAALRYCARHPLTNLSVHSELYSTQAAIAHAFSPIVLACDDPAVLRKTLDELNLLAPHLKHPVAERAFLLLLVEQLNGYSREDAAAVLASGKTGWDCARFVVPPLALGRTFEAILMEKMGGKQGPGMEEIVHQCFRGLTVSSWPDRLEYVILSHRWNSLSKLKGFANVCELAAFAYDSLRMETAGRLYFLEKGAVPKSVDDLIPGYIKGEASCRTDRGNWHLDASGKVYFTYNRTGKSQRP